MTEAPNTLRSRLGGDITDAMQKALAFLDAHDTAALLARVGQTIEELPALHPAGKAALQDSYGGDQVTAPDDLLAARGMFYVTEQRRLCLDCTAGHYQMTWGYNDPSLVAAANEAVDAGIIWDGHCNIPQTPVKRLAERLVDVAGGAGPDGNGLDTVLLGCVTGSVACAAALKIQLLVHQRACGDDTPPVIVVLDGNYHGTDMVAQYLRGMWPQYVKNIDVRTVQPNDIDELRGVFARCGKQIAGFWAEPIMMNREAIVVEPAYLQAARALCDEHQALMCIDEIQTGFWQPEVFLFKAMGIVPDLVIAGKGMTAGFHPQSAVIYRSELDVLATYDAISTNGSAPLACYMGLCCLDRITGEADRLTAAGDRFEAAVRALPDDLPKILRDARGRRHMMGLKFHDVNVALDFHRRAVASGLWVRVHAYHEGHSTVLAKLPLVADEQTVDFVAARLRQLLQEIDS